MMRFLAKLLPLAAGAVLLAGANSAPAVAKDDAAILVHDHRRGGYNYGPPPRRYRGPPPRAYYGPPPRRYYPPRPPVYYAPPPRPRYYYAPPPPPPPGIGLYFKF
ncbi:MULTISPECIES: hypothetical protein [Roseomonadaceae]|uniref:Uncharacterized protein n=1 Tax=Falsiroseomonas oleicola TaxID=2801474 RepID=A0ABS6HBG4_9PROT|nr:hypothetical protein [Roseomonas oleicola]MBU8546054.1 hypothetical protein [Roseomonas oleicola]